MHVKTFRYFHTITMTQYHVSMFNVSKSYLLLLAIGKQFDTILAKNQQFCSLHNMYMFHIPNTKQYSAKKEAKLKFYINTINSLSRSLKLQFGQHLLE